MAVSKASANAFKLEVFHTPYSISITASRDNNNKKKKEVYTWLFWSQTCEVNLQSYEYFERNERGHWEVANWWHRTQTVKKLNNLKMKDIPAVKGMKDLILGKLISKIKFEPFKDATDEAPKELPPLKPVRTKVGTARKAKETKAKTKPASGNSDGKRKTAGSGRTKSTKAVASKSTAKVRKR